MSAAASGGLMGMVPGEGWLHNVPAADTDLVFGMLCEEWGLIIAVLAVLSIVTLAVFAARACRAGRSASYTIAACAATSMLVFDRPELFGPVDLLPPDRRDPPLCFQRASSFVLRFFSDGGRLGLLCRQPPPLQPPGQLYGGGPGAGPGRGRPLLGDESGNRSIMITPLCERLPSMQWGMLSRGAIGTGALVAFADQLSGYNLLTGADNPFGQGNDLYLTLDARTSTTSPTRQ